MFPRHIERCCEGEGHMAEDDPWILNNNRVEVDRDITRKVADKCKVISWYELLGLDSGQGA